MIRESCPFFEALIKDDIEEGLRLQREGFDPKKVLFEGFTMLEMAKFLGKTRFFRLLDPNYPVDAPVQLQGELGASNYLFSEWPRLFRASFCPSLVFSSLSFFQKMRSQSPYFLRWPLFSKKEREIYERVKELLHASYFPKVSIQWIDQTIGFGVFSMQTILKESFVMEYGGVLMPKSKTTRNPYRMLYPTRIFSPETHVIDASNQGSIARFINHSKKANLEVEALFDRGLVRVVLLAKRDIAKGEQLFIDYGFL